MAYTWGYAGAATMLDHILPKPNVIGLWSKAEKSQTYELIQSVYHNIYANITPYASKLLGLLNVRYLIVDSALDTNFYPTSPLNTTLNALNGQNGIVYLGKFGNLLLYEK